MSSPNRRAFEVLRNYEAHNERQWPPLRENWAPEKDDIIVGVCKQCMVGVICEFEGHEKEIHIIQVGNGEGGDRLLPFIVITNWTVIELTWSRGGIT